MTTALVVIEPFNGNEKGRIITNPTEIETVLESEFANNVVKIQIPA